MLSLIILLSAIALVASSSLPATDIATSLDYQHASFLYQSGANNTDTGPLFGRQIEMQVGSSCHGLEGEWYCMTTTFQRCASGQWSPVLSTAYGTVCEPEGFTYGFQPAFASWFPTGDKTQTVVCTETATATTAATATGDATDAIRTGSSDAPVTANAASRSAIWAMLLGLASTALLFLAM